MYNYTMYTYIVFQKAFLYCLLSCYHFYARIIEFEKMLNMEGPRKGILPGHFRMSCYASCAFARGLHARRAGRVIRKYYCNSKCQLRVEPTLNER